MGNRLPNKMRPTPLAYQPQANDTSAINLQYISHRENKHDTFRDQLAVYFSQRE
jgi:hypothetical protein